MTPGAEARQLAQMLVDLAAGLEPWRELWPEIGEYLPRRGDLSPAATTRRVRLLRAIVERAERRGLTGR
jgi:hypothetical protein